MDDKEFIDIYNEEGHLRVEVGKIYTPSDFRLYVGNKELVGWDSWCINTDKDEDKE